MKHATLVLITVAVLAVMFQSLPTADAVIFYYNDPFSNTTVYTDNAGSLPFNYGSNMLTYSPVTNVSGDLAYGGLGCGEIPDEDFAEICNGKIVVLDRGYCTYVAKIYKAQLAGAIAVIIGNNKELTITYGACQADPRITIPAVMVPEYYRYQLLWFLETLKDYYNTPFGALIKGDEWMAETRGCHNIECHGLGYCSIGVCVCKIQAELMFYCNVNWYNIYTTFTALFWAFFVFELCLIIALAATRLKNVYVWLFMLAGLVSTIGYAINVTMERERFGKHDNYMSYHTESVVKGFFYLIFGQTDCIAFAIFSLYMYAIVPKFSGKNLVEKILRIGTIVYAVAVYSLSIAQLAQISKGDSKVAFLGDTTVDGFVTPIALIQAVLLCLLVLFALVSGPRLLTAYKGESRGKLTGWILAFLVVTVVVVVSKIIMRTLGYAVTYDDDNNNVYIAFIIMDLINQSLFMLLVIAYGINTFMGAKKQLQVGS